MREVPGDGLSLQALCQDGVCTPSKVMTGSFPIHYLLVPLAFHAVLSALMKARTPPLCSADVKNAWIGTSIPLYMLMI